MSTRVPYTYMVLRYRHDPISGEMMNVGVLLRAPGFLKLRARHTIGRLSKTFPDIDTDIFRATLRGLERFSERLSQESAIGLLGFEGDAKSFARQMLPDDDSSYIWGPLGSGLSEDPALTLDRLYERFVSKYDERSRAQRDDAAVWKPVKDKLAERNLANRLQEKTISSNVDSVAFEHAWKNGSWHCYQPLSFDLANEENIRDKARRWAGHMLALTHSEENFKPHFFVGAPSEKPLIPAYRAAIGILRLSPVSPQVIEEEDIDILVNQIEDEIRSHDAQQKNSVL